MKRVATNLRPVSLGLATGVIVFSSFAGAHAEDVHAFLSSRLSEASKFSRYEPIGRAELRKAESLFVETINSFERFSALRTRWRELGWGLEQIQIPAKDDTNLAAALEHPSTDHDTIYVLAESRDDIRGRGFFVFRQNPDLPICIQSPHSFHDEHTDQISLRLFEDSRIAAAAWNTVHRSVVDAAHDEGTYIDAFTRASLQTDTPFTFIQIHGFAKANRKTMAGRTSDVIISNSTRYPGPTVRSVASELTEGFNNASVRLFPQHISELGGTTNAQAQLIHHFGYDNFIHIELSMEFRKSLLNQKMLQDRFNSYLFSSLSKVRADTE